MLGRRATTERLFQFIGNISTDEHSFTIDHLFRGLLMKSIQQLMKDASVFRLRSAAIISNADLERALSR